MVALIQVLRPFSDHAGYRRWAEIEANAGSESERKVARDLMNQFVLRLAVSDHTRRDRISGLGVGVGGLVVSSIIFVMATGAFGGLPVVGWVLTVIALVIYIVALWVLVFYPDRLRDRARAELVEQLRPAEQVDVGAGIASKLVEWISHVSRIPRHTAAR